MRPRKLWNRPFWTGVLVGAALLVLGRVAINESTIPDLLIAPMLVEDSAAPADAIVVLGAGVIGDCVPNLNGMRRALLGARLFRSGRAPFVAITGGAGRDHCPVADAMAQVARDAGVPADRLILERESMNTHENAERTAPLLRERRVSRILVVTDRLHMRRATGVFRQQGFAVEPVAVPIYEGHVDNVSMLSAGVREAIALTYYRLRGWTTSAAPAAAHAPTNPPGSTPIGTSGGELASGRVVNTKNIEIGSPQRTPASDRRPIVILGASYAAGWKLSDVEGFPVVNAGIAGQQSSEMIARFDQDVVAARPRMVVLWGFINDFFRTDAAAAAAARVRENYTAMIERARANAIEPIIATEVTIRPPKAFAETAMSMVGWLLGKESYQDRINQHVVETNRWLRDLGQREGVQVLDLQTTLSGADGRRRREFAADDGSHISAEGYAALTNYARPVLAERLQSATRTTRQR